MSVVEAEAIRLREPPGAVRPYVMESGAGHANLLLGQVGRVLIGTRETAGNLAVLTASGPKGRAIPLHYHDAEHEVFLCTRGRMQLWAGEESRILYPGDFGSVPAGTIHAYQFHGHHTSFLGPITPAGWERFFDFTGTPFATSAFPPEDRSPPPFEKFGRAEGEFKQHYRFDLKHGEATIGNDTILPGKRVPYFLEAGEGPRHLAFGQTSTLLSTGAESNGELGMAIIEGPRGASMPSHSHAKTYEAIYCFEGALDLKLDGTTHRIIPGECVNIPAGCVHSYVMTASVTRIATMNGPAGIERLFELAGEAWAHPIFPTEPSRAVDVKALMPKLAAIDIRFA